MIAFLQSTLIYNIPMYVVIAYTINNILFFYWWVKLTLLIKK